MTRTLPPRVLIAEDHDEFRRFLAESFRSQQYDVTECGNGLELIDQLRSVITGPAQASPFDLIVSDIRMPGVTGLSVLAGLHEIQGAPPVILITAFGDAETHAEAQRLGAVATIDKPFEISALLSKAEDILRDRNQCSSAPLAAGTSHAGAHVLKSDRFSPE